MKRPEAKVESADELAWLALSRFSHLNTRQCLQLAAHFGSARAALEAPASAWEEVVGEKTARAARTEPPAWDWAARQWKNLQQRGGRLLTLGASDYPVLLREIALPPPVLFVLGEGLPDAPGLAIVGSRSATDYGCEVARRLGRDLAVRGFCIVSGMARGVDTAAHQGALEAGGRTVAVLGCGADVVYPADNVRLHKQIQGQGAVVSEFPMGSRPGPGSFPRRNRIISGLSSGVVIVEAPARSGALITASCALEQNREVFAVPGDIRHGQSAGCHRLIREGARLVEGVEDVVEELAHLFPRNELVEAALEAAKPELSADEHALLAQFPAGPCHIDQLTEGVALSPAEVLDVLLKLELAGLVEQRPGKHFARVG